MVIRVLVEGGVTTIDPTVTIEHNSMIQQNSAALREALNKFFSKSLNREDIDIKIEVGGGWMFATHTFITKNNNDYLYVDLDRPPEKREEWFTQQIYDREKIPLQKADCIFFWIPEMEAWFLKQPECITKWAHTEKITIKETANISEDKLIKGKDIEHLAHKPSSVMKVIFNRYLLSNKMGKNRKPKKIEYGKLRHAPGLINFLDPQRMITQDKELSNFVNRVLQNQGKLTM
ncbi:MAG: DUF4276 family protein [Bacteroidales bacterium]|nr:DUF4276 family protein [Bacteroidales bacterium]